MTWSLLKSPTCLISHRTENNLSFHHTSSLMANFCVRCDLSLVWQVLLQPNACCDRETLQHDVCLNKCYELTKAIVSTVFSIAGEYACQGHYNGKLIYSVKGRSPLQLYRQNTTVCMNPGNETFRPFPYFPWTQGSWE